MGTYKIAVIDGDGIGPEVTDAAITVLDAVAHKFGHTFEYTHCLMGGAAIDKTGVPLPEETIELCRKSDAVLLGAVGGPQWDKLTGSMRPEKGLLGIRKALKLFANIRPAKLYRELRKSCPLRSETAKKGIDLIVVRELTGGIYFGERGYLNGGNAAFDTETYSVEEIERIARVAFEIAATRRKKITSVDKANVLETSRLWRATVEKTAKDYPGTAVEHMLVDNAAMQLIKNPSQFDVILTSNMFGDILSDEASMLTGSIGVLPSSSVGVDKPALYEPIHGSAPDIAGKDVANPIATVLSASMMLAGSFNLSNEAATVENAVQAVLGRGYRTADLSKSRFKTVGTQKMAELIALEVINS